MASHSQQPPQIPAKVGRPSSYTPEMAEMICERIADGESLRAIVASSDVPASGTIYRWLEEQPAFQEQYQRARGRQADLYAEQVIEISDTCRIGEKVERKEIGRTCSMCGSPLRWLQGAWAHHDSSVLCDGATAEKVIEEKTIYGDMIERARLQVEARKWATSKLAPKKYGDRLEIDAKVEISIADRLAAARRRVAEPEQTEGDNG